MPGSTNLLLSIIVGTGTDVQAVFFLLKHTEVESYVQASSVTR